MNAKQKAVMQLLELKERRKATEQAIDQQLQHIGKLMKPGETVELDDTAYELKDFFAETNLVWRAVPVYRFDIAEVKE